MTKRVQVHSNDSVNPVMGLRVQATANMHESNFTWNPDQADFNEVLIGKGGKFEMEFQNNDSNKVELEVVSEPDKDVVEKYKIDRLDLKPGQKTKIKIELREDLPPGGFKTAMTVQHRDDENLRFTIPISGRVVETLSPPKPIAKKTTSTATSQHPTSRADIPPKKKPQPQVKKPREIKRTPSKTTTSSESATKEVPLTTMDDSDMPN